MADWTNLDEFLEDLEFSYYEANDKRGAAQFYWDLADYNFTMDPASYVVWGRQTLDALQYLIRAVDYLVSTNVTFMPPYAVPYGFKYHTGAVTMDSILDAMWDSDKLRNFHFINYIDSMRAGIWNTEIYETHLADWYRHFSL